MHEPLRQVPEDESCHQGHAKPKLGDEAYQLHICIRATTTGFRVCCDDSYYSNAGCHEFKNGGYGPEVSAPCVRCNFIGPSSFRLSKITSLLLDAYSKDWRPPKEAELAQKVVEMGGLKMVEKSDSALRELAGLEFEVLAPNNHLLGRN